MGVCFNSLFGSFGYILGEDKFLVKPIEENIFVTLDGLNLVKQNPKNINHKEKINELDYVKIKKICFKRIP